MLRLRKRRRTRGPKFLEKYDRFYQNEIDSLPALRPREFREMVTRPIDEEIYRQILEEYSSADIRKMLRKRIKFLCHNY